MRQRIPATGCKRGAQRLRESAFGSEGRPRAGRVSAQSNKSEWNRE